MQYFDMLKFLPYKGASAIGSSGTSPAPTAQRAVLSKSYPTHLVGQVSHSCIIMYSDLNSLIIHELLLLFLSPTTLMYVTKLKTIKVY